MTKIKLHLFTMLVVMCFSMMQAQNDTLINPVKITEYDKLMDSNYKDSVAAKYIKIKKETDTEKKKNYSGNWIIGAGINMVEDSGNQTFSDFFTLKHKNWGLPLMLSAEYLTSNRFSFSATLLFNTYQTGKQIQFNTIQAGEEPNYMAIDLAAKLFFRKILSKHIFTPYITAGPGYRHIGAYQTSNLVDVPKTQDITINAGLGTYYWFNRSWGLNFNYMAKFGLKGAADQNNHLVSSFGVFYRFDTASK